MKKTALILTLIVALTAIVGCGCTRQNPTEPISSVPTIPEIVSSIPMPPLPPESVPPYSSSQIVKPTMGADFNEIGTLPNAPIVWGPGTRRDSDNRSEACVALQQRFKDYSCDFIMPNEQKIYLTFDQGYENGFTEKILDTLKEKNVKAVFFVTGHYVKTAPDLVKRMIDEGHTVANHSFDHLNHATSSLESAYEDTKELHDYVEENFGYTMNLFRYPEGTFNEQVLKMHQQMGYKTVFWSFAYKDWDPKNQMAPEQALQKLSGGLQPGSIVLMHTVGSTNATVLGDFIDNARAQGYSVELYS